MELILIFIVFGLGFGVGYGVREVEVSDAPPSLHFLTQIFLATLRNPITQSKLLCPCDQQLGR